MTTRTEAVRELIVWAALAILCAALCCSGKAGAAAPESAANASAAESAPAKLETAPAKSATSPAKPESAPAKLETAPAKSATSPAKPGAAPATEPAKELTLDLGGGVTMKFNLIPAGKFMRRQYLNGVEKDPYEVTISKPFYMGVYEVTQEQYERVMGKNPSKFKGATNPVESVSSFDGEEFCKKLSEKTGRTVRLPTEAEWEYACRAGTQTHFSFGDAETDLGDYGWYRENSNNTTHPVGQKKPNPWGLYDMHGNVWEWCWDWYGNYPAEPVTDPQGPASSPSRVLRSGAYDYPADRCGSHDRSDWSRSHAVDNYPTYGLRVAVSVSAPGQ